MSNPRRGLDINLLLLLHTLLEERSLTRAAHKLLMGQPAVSAGLGRLRRHYGDDLLVREGKELRLTELAHTLRPVVNDAVRAAGALLGESDSFDPTSSTRRFTVSLSEYTMTVLAEPIATEFANVSASCSISFECLPTTRRDYDASLLRQDLVIFPAGVRLPGDTQPIFRDELVWVVARDNPYLDEHGALDLEALQRLPHAVATFGDVPRASLIHERVAALHGLADRTVQVTVSSMLTLPYVVAGTTLCATVPSRLAVRCRDTLDLVIASTPLPPMPFVESARWHPGRATDPAHRWLLGLLTDVAGRLPAPPVGSRSPVTLPGP